MKYVLMEIQTPGAAWGDGKLRKMVAPWNTFGAYLSQLLERHPEVEVKLTVLEDKEGVK